MSSPRIPGNRRVREPATTLRTIAAPVLPAERMTRLRARDELRAAGGGRG